MDSRFNLLELSDTIDGLSDNFSKKQLASCSRTVGESEPYCVSTNNFPNRSIDCKFSGEPPIDNVKSSEEIGSLNSNSTLRYIRQLLMEEDTEEKISSYEEELALLATEKAFHDILRQEYYPSPDEPFLHDPANQMSSGHDVHSVKSPLANKDLTSALPIESLTAKQIQKGIDEAMKFLPNIGEFFTNQGTNESISGRDWPSRTKKNPSDSDLDKLVRRAPKQIFAYSDEPIRNENFDTVLLLNGQRYIQEDTMLRKIMQKQMREHSQRSQAKVSNYAMKQCMNQTMEQPVDLSSLLINCSKAISANDHSMANELIRKIRKCSSPNGDWTQRLAYYFVDGLEARLSGTENDIYHRILPEKQPVIEALKAYRMYLAVSPCRRALVDFANQTILNNISKHTSKVHIIIYGIIYGFQWPAFFEHLSDWKSTPPKIRITIVKAPEPGFRPRRRVDLIGRRLADYAESFNVPFEYEGIVSKWENVKVEDMKIANDEVIIVNCILHSERLSDEAIGMDSPRDIFLNTIRRINPHLFIHVNFNGSYNSPFFPARFRDALWHYSSLFEMLDSNLPRDNPERLFIEKNFLMPGAINAIAFEGPDRVERPETYKQWHARKLRAGLVPLPLDSMIKNNFKDFVREHYHKDFVIDDDNGWLLVGWKGRILYGLSAWKAKEF